MRIGLFIPCFVDAFYPEAAIASLRLLEHLGLHVEYPAEQTCCGQPQFNAGLHDDARELAARFCGIFDRYDFIVSPSGSCTSMVRNHYPSLIGPHPVCSRTFELCEFLVEHAGCPDFKAKLRGRAALHVGCHQRRELGAAPAVQQLLERVQGLQLVPTGSDTWCCGFGGTFSVKFPELSAAMAARRLDAVLAAEADYLISTDASCLMQLAGVIARRKLSSPTPLHVAQVLATGLGAT